MSKITEIWTKICRRWEKIRLQPIRVFCFHHVSDMYDKNTMWELDWTNTEVLKQWIKEMQRHGYVFISLSEAHEKLSHDMFRCTKYAVLTADDGFKTMKNIVPWLIEQNIPITLFVNPKYIIEDEIGENVKMCIEKSHVTIKSDEIYLSMQDIQAMQSPYVSFGYHGFEHLDEMAIDEDKFVENVEQCVEAMSKSFPNVISFYAHTYGHVRKANDIILDQKGIIPIYTSGAKNINRSKHIDREVISNERLLKGIIHA